MRKHEKNDNQVQDLKLLLDMTKQKNIGGEKIQKYLVDILEKETNIYPYAISSIQNFSPVLFLMEEAGHSLKIKDFNGRNLLYLFLKRVFLDKNYEKNIMNSEMNFELFIKVLSKNNSWYEESTIEKSKNPITFLVQHLLNLESKTLFRVLKICEENDINWGATLNSNKDTIFHILIETEKEMSQQLEKMETYEKEKKYVNLFVLFSFFANKCDITQKNKKDIDPLRSLIYILDKIYDEKIIAVEHLKSVSEILLKTVPKEKINYYYSFFFSKEHNNILDKEKLILELIENGWKINNHLSSGQTILGTVVYNFINDQTNQEEKINSYENVIKKLLSVGANPNQKNIFGISVMDLISFETVINPNTKKILTKLKQWGLIQEEKTILLKTAKNQKNYNKKYL